MATGPFIGQGDKSNGYPRQHHNQRWRERAAFHIQSSGRSKDTGRLGLRTEADGPQHE